MTRRLRPYLLLFLTLVGYDALSQNFPVRIAPILSPPYTPFLTDYIEAGSDKLALHITLNDITIPQYRCKLRVTIEGVNISITTHPNFTPLPLTLAGGVPEILYGSDLSEYFKASNLIFKGISLEDFEKKGSQLPEGIYRFSFEVLDYNRGTVVSNIGSATAWMILNDPPIINLPVNNAKLKPLNPQNLVFQWTPRHRGSPNAAFTTEYDVKLVEIWPQGRNPYDAINTSLPIYETTTDNTLVVYGPAETPLVLGREYALQVRARDTGGKDLFKNKGYSEVVRFIYGDECPIPSSLSVDEIGTLKARLKWQGSNLNTGYTLRYRESKDGAEWFEQRTDQTYINAGDMKPGTAYEYEVCGECETFRSEYSQEQKFKTLTENPNAFVCKDPNAIPIIDGSPPLPALMINDTIKAGGFHVIVSQAMGSNGNFSGKGVAIVPWFNSAKVNVTFENISVNKGHQLTKGTINSVWDPTSKFLIDVPAVLSEKGQTQLETITATFEADTLIKTSGVILSVFINPADKNIVVQTTGGETIINRSEGKAYAITDQSGNGFLVDKDGKITKTTAEIATNAASRGERNYNTNPNLGLHFARTSDTKYGLDEQRDGTLTQNYQQASNGNWIAWKALSTGQTENLQGITEGSTKSEKVKFKVEGLNSQDLVSTADLQLQLTGQAEGTIEEVLAYYVETDTAKHPPILAKINTISYSAIQKNLVVVRVNDAPLSIDPSSLEQRLNEIYQQAVVTWSTVQLEELTVGGVDTKNLDDGESGLLSNYTADMRAIINAYTAKQPLAAETYYLFLVEQAHNPAKLGYMPRKKQAGFIFTQPHGNSNDIVVTMAHELAHGAFRLEHTFSEFPSLLQGTTDNLLDYNQGTRLNKYQWDNIHDPVSMLSLFDDDDEGASIAVQAQVREYLAGFGFLDECLLRALGRSMKEMDLSAKFFAGAIEGALCATEEDKCASDEYWTKFSYGFTNGLIQQLDVFAMRDAMISLLKDNIKAKLDCILKGELLKVSITSDATLEEQFQYILKCQLGIDISIDEIKKIYDKVQKYVEANYKSPYLRGQATVLVLTLVLPPITKAIQAGKVTQIINKFKAIEGFSAEAANLEKLAAAKAEEVGGVLDDLAKQANSDIIELLTGSIKSTYDELIALGLKSEIKANSILIKGASGETVAIIYNGKLTPTKWAWQKNFPSSSKTLNSEGYIAIKDGTEIKFDLGFKEGRKLEAKEVNDYLVNGQGKDLNGQPYWAGTQVEEVVLGKNGETIYFVENYNGGAANPGQYASKEAITTIKELREKMAVKEAWKETANQPTLRTYRVKTDLKARSGIIGRQSDNGLELPGGGHQYEIIDYLGSNWRNYLEEIGPKNGVKLEL